MPAKLVVPRSQEGAFIWQTFALLDFVETRDAFIERLLEAIAVRGADRSRAASVLRERLPASANEIAPAVVAEVLEECGVLEWVEDRTLVLPATETALLEAVTTVVRDAPKGAMPRRVAESLMAETSRVLGTLLDAPTAHALHASFVETLDRDLWRRPDNVRSLSRTLVDQIMTAARLVTLPL